MIKFMLGGGNMSSSYLGEKSNVDINDNYTILRKLGEGNYGVVYLARDKVTDQEFAIKQINPRKGEKKFIKKELDFLQRLNNPNLIEFYEYYENKKNNQISFVTLPCLGGELFDHITTKEYSSLSPQQRELNAKIIMYQLISGVKYMHDVGIMHRDLKPENVLLVEPNLISDIRIIDFGLSINIEENDNSSVGTPYYMAPEVIKKDYNSKCDNWSLGIIMYILLCGYPPYNGFTDQQIIDEIRFSEHKPLEFDSQDWKNISSTAKDLVKSFLKHQLSHRISLDKALKTNWFRGFSPSKYIIKPQD